MTNERAANGRRGLHGTLVDEIGGAIVAGTIGPDDVLDLAEIGARFGVSRTAVRETLRVLEAKGLVSARPRTGTRVQSPAHWNALDADVIAWRQAGGDATRQRQQLLELRAAVEPAAARLAAMRATSMDVAALWLAYHGMESALAAADLEAFRSADRDFHRALLAAGGNDLFARLADTVGAALRARETSIATPEQVDAEAMRQHRRVAAAVERGDADAAESALRAIVAQVASDAG